MNAPSNRGMRLVPRKDRDPGVAAKSGWLRTVNREAAHRWVARAAAASPARSASAPTARTREETPGSDRTPGLSAALRAVIEELPPTEITEFIDTVTGTGGGLDPALWGSPPSTTDAARAHLVTLTAKFSDRQTVLAQSITRAEASALLGISDQAVSDRLTAGDLVGLKDGRVWRLPAWQFDADTENGWLPGIAQLRRHFPAGPVTLTGWVTAPNVDLDDRTPAARLAAGDVDQVLLAARASGPPAW